MIELKPLIGKNVATGKAADTGQDRIFLNGKHVGYVQRKPNSPIALIVNTLDAETKQSIQDAVAAQYGGETRPMGEPVDIPDEVLDDDDDDDMEDDYSDE